MGGTDQPKARGGRNKGITRAFSKKQGEGESPLTHGEAERAKVRQEAMEK